MCAIWQSFIRGGKLIILFLFSCRTRVGTQKVPLTPGLGPYYPSFIDLHRELDHMFSARNVCMQIKNATFRLYILPLGF